MHTGGSSPALPGDWLAPAPMAVFHDLLVGAVSGSMVEALTLGALILGTYHLVYEALGINARVDFYP